MKIFLPKWPSSHGRIWVVAVAVAYALTWLFNDLIASGMDVVEDRISLLFLPAFIRVAAIMIAGLAGWLGLFLGSLAIGLVWLGDPLELALLHSTATTLSVGLAVVLVAGWLGKRSGCLNSINMKAMLLTAGLAALFNASFHGLAWESQQLHFTEALFWMMIAGDLGGVALGYLLLRFGVRTWRARALPPA